MNNLTPRQRVKISAALALIHDYGHDAKAVGRSAQADIARGLNPKGAYERAFTDFAKGKPDLSRALSHTLRLIDASDDQTVTRYGDALEQYNQTGNPQAMAAVTQTFVQDSIALAVRNGEISPEDASNPEAVSGAFGFPFDEGAGERVIAMAGMTASPAAAPAQAPQAPRDAPPAQSSPAPVRASIGDAHAKGWSYSAPKDRSAAAFKPIDRQPVTPGSGPVIEKQGWTPSDTYG